jgi:hypothetical protein
MRGDQEVDETIALFGARRNRASAVSRQAVFAANQFTDLEQ